MTLLCWLLFCAVVVPKVALAGDSLCRPERGLAPVSAFAAVQRAEVVVLARATRGIYPGRADPQGEVGVEFRILEVLKGQVKGSTVTLEREPAFQRQRGHGDALGRVDYDDPGIQLGAPHLLMLNRLKPARPAPANPLEEDFAELGNREYLRPGGPPWRIWSRSGGPFAVLEVDKVDAPWVSVARAAIRIGKLPEGEARREAIEALPQQLGQASSPFPAFSDLTDSEGYVTASPSLPW